VRSTSRFQPSPSNFGITIGRVGLLGVLAFSGWAGCQANSDGFADPSAKGGKAGGATGTAGQTGGAADAAPGGSPSLDALPLVAADAATGGSTVPQSTGLQIRDAGSALSDARGGQGGAGGVGGQGTATGGFGPDLDAGTPVDAPLGGTTDTSSGAGGDKGGTVTGGAAGNSTSTGGTAGGASGGTTGGTISAPADAGADVFVKADTTVAPDAATPDHADASPWRLVWSDEFDREADSGIVATKWNASTWEPGTVNGEEQKYTARRENIFHDGQGNLILRALNDPYRPSPGTTYDYTSGRIQTDGKFEFKFGRVEIRAKLPVGQGSFPGMLLMGTNGGWPQNGEIGLMEQYGQDKASIYCSTYSNSQSDISKKVTFPTTTTLSAQFHTYALEWYADHMVFFVDDEEVARKTFNASSPFANDNNDFYIILDVALGGDKGGTINDEAFPMDMVLDYVRVYSLQ
jgi:beta-glucanase (GH16 family)